MKLYQIIWLATFLLLAINVPDYFTCTEDCHFFRDYTKWLPDEDQNSRPINTNPNSNPASPNNDESPAPPNNDESDSDSDNYDDDEEDNETNNSIFDKNEAMLVWSTIFKDQTMLRSIASSVWDKNIPALPVRPSPEQVNKAMKKLNQALKKIATERSPGIHRENSEGFPFRMIGYPGSRYDKTEFLREVEWTAFRYWRILEILGERLMPAIKTVYDEKYKHLENTMGSKDVYYFFFYAVTQEIWGDEDLEFSYLEELHEAIKVVYQKDGQWHFSWEDLIMVVRDNFSREFERTSFYDSHMFRFYKKEVLREPHNCT